LQQLLLETCVDPTSTTIRVVLFFNKYKNPITTHTWHINHAQLKAGARLPAKNKITPLDQIIQSNPLLCSTKHAWICLVYSSCMLYALIAGSCSIVGKQLHNEVVSLGCYNKVKSAFRKHGASPKHCRKSAGRLPKQPLQHNTMDMDMHISSSRIRFSSESTGCSHCFTPNFCKI
jgi:hypothetical protein